MNEIPLDNIAEPCSMDKSIETLFLRMAKVDTVLVRRSAVRSSFIPCLSID